MKTLARIGLVAAIGASLVCFAGCGSKANIETNATTVGQELQDLEKARDDGLITDGEYKKQRKRILDRK